MREAGNSASRTNAMILQPSDESLTNDLYQEIRKGIQVKESFQQVREAACSRLAQLAREAQANSPMGRIAAIIPQEEYFQIGFKYGMECWDDRGFVRDFQRLEPSMAVSKV